MILARNIIALARINDVTGTTYYYKSQVSTAAKPAKPTAATPSGWSTTEPAYNAANSVYVTVKTTYSDNSFSYSDVSLASAYEGAKEAHNTAASAKSTAEAAMEQSVEYITGTQTGATGSWTGVTSDTALAVGKTIAYKLPFAGSGNASLTLTLAGGSKTAAIPVYLNTTRVTTHFGAGAVINMTYDGSAWRASSIPNSNETNHILNNFCGKTGVLGIWRYALFMRDGSGAYQNICTAADGTITSTVEPTKKPNPNGFEPGSSLYYSSGSGYSANANISSYVYASYGAFDSRYSFNTTLTAGSLTTYKNVYLVGTISQEDGLFYLDEVWWTQTPDTKGKIYILVGSCYDSTTSNCRISLYEQNTWYIHNGTGLTPYNDALSQKAQETADEAQASALTAYNTAMNAMPKYTTCTTAEGTTAKVTGTVQNLTKPLVLGQKVAVTFSKKNTATAPTLNVSGTGAYPIRTSNGSALPKTNVEDSSEVGWGANSLVTFVFDGQYWRMDDADALTKIDNILTKNIVGTNGWINLGEGEFVFSDADTGDSIGFNDGVLNLTGTINGSVIQGEDLNIEGEGYESGYTPTPGELVIVPKYRYWLRTKKAYYTDTDENDNETTYPYKYLQIVTNVQRATLAEVLAELSVEFSPFFGLEVNASPLGGYGDLFSVTDGGATRLVFRSNYDDYTQKDYTDLVLEGPDPRLVIDDSITVSGNVHVDGELTAKPKSQSRSIQTVSGITVGSLQVYTSAGFCAVTLELTSKTTLSDWTTIATGMPIPAVTWYDTMTNWENAYHRPYRVAVTTSGNLNIRYGAGSSSDATAYRISFVYPMAT